MMISPRRVLRHVVSSAVTVAVVAVLAACTGLDPAETTPRGPASTVQPFAPGRYVVGYFVRWGAGRDYRVKNVQDSGSAAKLSHLVYAFGNVTDGRCTVGDPYADHDQVYTAAQSVDGVADTAGQPLRGNFNQLRKLKKLNPHLKILWSFGGWTGSAGFTAAARNPQGFADSCRKLVEDPRWADVFDGIDVDWEYPNACGLACDSSGPEAFGELVSGLRAQFPAGELVTAAITGDGRDQGRLDATNYAGAAGSLDWIMVMTYDYVVVGKSPGPTAPHAPLTSYAGIPPQSSYGDAAIRKLKGKGIPASKLLLGVGFYGRGWTGVSQPAPGARAAGPAPGTYEPGIEDYKVLVKSCPPTGMVGGTAYAVCGDRWWSYDTPDTISAKMAYARSQGLAGSFFWELSGDTPDGQLISAMRSTLG